METLWTTCDNFFELLAKKNNITDEANITKSYFFVGNLTHGISHVDQQLFILSYVNENIGNLLNDSSSF